MQVGVLSLYTSFVSVEVIDVFRRLHKLCGFQPNEDELAIYTYIYHGKIYLYIYLSR